MGKEGGSTLDIPSLGLLWRLNNYFRLDDWLFSVLPLVLAAPLFCLMRDRVLCPVDSFLRVFVLFAIFSFVFLSFGYLINDYSDREEDKLAGKVKVLFSVPDSLTVRILALQVILGMSLSWLMSDGDISVFLVAAFTYLLGASYSLPGLRLKQRGVLGLICSSFAQRGMLVVLAAFVFGMDPLLAADWAALSFLNGLRYIIIHQMIDLDNDRLTHTHTFAQSHSLANLRTAIRAILIVEIGLLIPSVIIPLWSVNWLVTAISLVVYLIITAVLTSIFKFVFGKDDLLYTYDLVPLESFLNTLVPLAGAIALAKSESAFFLFAIAIVAMGTPLLVSKCKNLVYVRTLFSSISSRRNRL